VSKKVKLSVLGISFSQVQAGAYALLFGEDGGLRRLPVVIGMPEAQSIALILEGLTPPRPLAHDLICAMWNKLGITMQEAVIHKIEDGAFVAELLLLHNGKQHRFDSRTSDAVALAVRTGAPIFTTETIMRQMAIVVDEKPQPEGAPEPCGNEPPQEDDKLSALQLDALNDRLRDAVKDENYELATRLRDEIDRRKNKS
jgi:bifunctional DNase/RNase